MTEPTSATTEQVANQPADQAPNQPADQPVSEFGSPVADAAYRLVAEPIATVGGELIDVEWTGGTLRLVVDAPGGVTTERLAEVNRLVSPLLDQHDPVPGRYLLEVSSPGVERPLRRPDHFRRAVGEQVIVKLESWSEIRRLRGELLSADDNGISVSVVEIDGVDLAEAETHDVPHDTIAKARTHFDWGPTPKKGGKGSQGPRKKSSTKNQSSNNKRKKR